MTVRSKQIDLSPLRQAQASISMNNPYADAIKQVGASFARVIEQEKIQRRSDLNNLLDEAQVEVEGIGARHVESDIDAMQREGAEMITQARQGFGNQILGAKITPEMRARINEMKRRIESKANTINQTHEIWKNERQNVDKLNADFPIDVYALDIEKYNKAIEEGVLPAEDATTGRMFSKVIDYTTDQVNSYLKKSFQDFASSNDQYITKSEHTSVKDGVEYTNNKKTVGGLQAVVDYLSLGYTKNPVLKNAITNWEAGLTPEQRAKHTEIATQINPQAPKPMFIGYALEHDLEKEWSLTKVDTKQKPSNDGRGGSGEPKLRVEKKVDTWSFMDKPLRIAGFVDYQDDEGETKKTAAKGTLITQVKYIESPDGSLQKYAIGVTPTSEDHKLDLENMSDMQLLAQIASTPSKYQTVRIPYNELDSELSRHVDLVGIEEDPPVQEKKEEPPKAPSEITVKTSGILNKKRTYSLDGAEYSEDEMVEMYKKDFPNKTEEEIRNRLQKLKAK